MVQTTLGSQFCLLLLYVLVGCLIDGFVGRVWSIRDGGLGK